MIAHPYLSEFVCTPVCTNRLHRLLHGPFRPNPCPESRSYRSPCRFARSFAKYSTRFFNSRSKPRSGGA